MVERKKVIIIETLDDKKRQRDKYEILVNMDISLTDFQGDLYKRFVKFLLTTIVIGYIFMWCSSTPDSNFFKLVQDSNIAQKAMFLLPHLLFVMMGIVLTMSMNFLLKKTEIQALLSYTFQKKVFTGFIKQKMNLEDTHIDDIKDIYLHQETDVCFTYHEYWEYMFTYINKKYKFKFPPLFSDHLTHYILYNEEINGTLVKDDNLNEYVFIIKDNPDFLVRMI